MDVSWYTRAQLSYGIYGGFNIFFDDFNLNKWRNSKKIVNLEQQCDKNELVWDILIN